MSNKTLLLSIVCLLVGFTCAYLIFGYNSNPLAGFSREESHSVTNRDGSSIDMGSYSTSFSGDTLNARFENIENNINSIQQQLQEIEFNLNEASLNQTRHASTGTNTRTSARRRSNFMPLAFTIDRLIRGGIDSTIAEDIVRRKNAVEIKRLELSDRATRENYSNTQRYFDELAEIDQTDVNLREELGDQQYDEYLYKSKQSNRIKILSVMLGSSAERAGLEKNDIVLSYDDKRMFTWSELKQATAEGQLGDYTSINISRNGEVYSYSIPRGTLGIQMGATRLSP